MTKLHFDPKISSRVKRLYLEFLEWLLTQTEITDLDITFYHKRSLFRVNKREAAYGAFRPGIIILASRPRDRQQLSQLLLLRTFTHEIIHYERWRDGKVNNHRGIEQRVKGLILKYLKYRRTNATS